jgi:hypothetical protein
MSHRIEFFAFVVLGLFVVVIFIVLSVSEHPSTNPYLPKCSFHFLTGLYCPGCGATRATYHLVHGQLAIAFRYQPLFVAMLPVIFFLIGKRLYELIFNTTVKLPFELQFYKLIAVVICAFFVLRNVPLSCFDWLRPLW